jgi:hypothetical protein
MADDQTVHDRNRRVLEMFTAGTTGGDVGATSISAEEIAIAQERNAAFLALAEELPNRPAVPGREKRTPRG